MNISSADADERIRVLEDELRQTKRAEMKLQGLLFRIRKDVEDSKSGLNIQNLLDERSLQYDVDRLTHKCEVRPHTTDCCDKHVCTGCRLWSQL